MTGVNNYGAKLKQCLLKKNKSPACPENKQIFQNEHVHIPTNNKICFYV